MQHSYFKEIGGSTAVDCSFTRKSSEFAQLDTINHFQSKHIRWKNSPREKARLREAKANCKRFSDKSIVDTTNTSKKYMTQLNELSKAIFYNSNVRR